MSLGGPDYGKAWGWPLVGAVRERNEVDKKVGQDHRFSAQGEEDKQ